MFKSKWKCSPFLKKWISRFLAPSRFEKTCFTLCSIFQEPKTNPKTILLEMPNLSVITSGINENLNIMKLKYYGFM